MAQLYPESKSPNIKLTEFGTNNLKDIKLGDVLTILAEDKPCNETAGVSTTVKICDNYKNNETNSKVSNYSTDTLQHNCGVSTTNGNIVPASAEGNNGKLYVNAGFKLFENDSDVEVSISEIGNNESVNLIVKSEADSQNPALAVVDSEGNTVSAPTESTRNVENKTVKYVKKVVTPGELLYGDTDVLSVTSNFATSQIVSGGTTVSAKKKTQRETTCYIFDKPIETQLGDISETNETVNPENTSITQKFDIIPYLPVILWRQSIDNINLQDITIPDRNPAQGSYYRVWKTFTKSYLEDSKFTQWGSGELATGVKYPILVAVPAQYKSSDSTWKNIYDNHTLVCTLESYVTGDWLPVTIQQKGTVTKYGCKFYVYAAVLESGGLDTQVAEKIRFTLKKQTINN